jgi:D-glycero-beta-D-manno-heptose-7-phosphate kinase
MSLTEGILKFSEQRVLVIGDVMMDAYCWGKVERISPEAPVPIVNVQQWDKRLGGAANVALNAISLGAKVSMCSVVGNDDQAKQLIKLLDNEGVQTRAIMHSPDRPTTVKTRVIAGGHHIVRIDEEVTVALNDKEETELWTLIEHELNENRPSIIILEDYNKGVLTPLIIKRVIEKANTMNIPTTVDPKKDHFWDYQGCTLFKPNLKEMREGLKLEIDPQSPTSLQNAVLELEAKMGNSISLLTLSEHGMMIHQQEEWIHEKAHHREVVDVSGAGDSVIATASLALSAGMKLKEVVYVANLAGGLVCEKVGVVPITQEMLRKEIQALNLA